MTTVVINLDDSQVVAALNRLTVATGDLTELFADIGEYLVRVHEDRWDDAIAPSGFAWPELTERTWARKLARGKQFPLVDEGDMLRGAISQPRRDGLDFGLNDWKAPIHHFGVSGTVNVPEHTRLVKKAFGKELKFPVYATVKAHSFVQNLPARELLGLSTADEREVLDIMADYVQGVINGG